MNFFVPRNLLEAANTVFLNKCPSIMRQIMSVAKTLC